MIEKDRVHEREKERERAMCDLDFKKWPRFDDHFFVLLLCACVPAFEFDEFIPEEGQMVCC